ncbi:MAG: sialidase family protein [Thermoplasmatota archaeon]
MRSSLAMAALLALGVLAGCLDDSPAPETTPTTIVPEEDVGYAFAAVDSQGLPVPLLLCHDMLPGAEGLHAAGERCNFNMTPDEGRQGNEVTIGVNPTDPRNVVGGAKDYYPADAGECVWDGVYVTHDGAKSTYEDRSFDGSPWRLASGDVEGFSPNYASQFWCTTDPVSYFDVNGNLYYLLMAYQADRVTGSKTCKDICPTGALNDWAFNRAVQIVAKSTDGGDTFDTFTPVLEGSFPVDFHDKGWVAASPDGTIHVMWLAALAPGNLYFRSTDGGQSFGDPVVMSTVVGNSGQGSFVEVGTDNEVYATWTSGSIYLRRSDDTGATWDEERAVLTPNTANMPGLSPRDRRQGFPAFATDRNPDSPYQNALYYVWQDECNGEWEEGCDGDGAAVYFSSSFDTGATFTKPVRVSKPHVGGTDYEIFPVVSVSPGGVIDVSWMDTEKAGMFNCTQETNCEDYGGKEYPGFTQKYAYSLDGGATWSDEFTVRDAPEAGWDPKLSHHQNGMIFIGDYNDIDSSWQAAHPVWPDTRDSQSVKVYTATIQRPMFAQGWEVARQVKALEFIAGHPLA